MKETYTTDEHYFVCPDCHCFIYGGVFHECSAVYKTTVSEPVFTNINNDDNNDLIIQKLDKIIGLLEKLTGEEITLTVIDGELRLIDKGSPPDAIFLKENSKLLHVRDND